MFSGSWGLPNSRNSFHFMRSRFFVREVNYVIKKFFLNDLNVFSYTDLHNWGRSVISPLLPPSFHFPGTAFCICADPCWMDCKALKIIFFKFFKMYFLYISYFSVPPQSKKYLLALTRLTLRFFFLPLSFSALSLSFTLFFILIFNMVSFYSFSHLNKTN